MNDKIQIVNDMIRDLRLAPSPRCLHLEEAASVFAAQLRVLLDQFEAERLEMYSSAVDRNDPCFATYEWEWAYTLAVVNAVADTTKKAWVELNSKPLTPAP